MQTHLGPALESGARTWYSCDAELGLQPFDSFLLRVADIHSAYLLRRPGWLAGWLGGWVSVTRRCCIKTLEQSPKVKMSHYRSRPYIACLKKGATSRTKEH